MPRNIPQPLLQPVLTGEGLIDRFGQVPSNPLGLRIRLELLGGTVRPARVLIQPLKASSQMNGSNAVLVGTIQAGRRSSGQARHSPGSAWFAATRRRSKRVARPRGSPGNLLKRKPPLTQERTLLSRGSQVRVLPGAPILTESCRSSDASTASRLRRSSASPRSHEIVARCEASGSCGVGAHRSAPRSIWAPWSRPVAIRSSALSITGWSRQANRRDPRSRPV